MLQPMYGPYEPFRNAGELVFISGQVGINPSDKTATRDIAGQTLQALSNLQAVLKMAKLKPGDVVKTTVYLIDMDHFAGMNEAYQTFFDHGPRPARSTIGVAQLPNLADEKLLVEIEAVAYRGGARHV